MSALQRLRPLAPIAVLALAALLRFWALGRPDTLVFDELYYARDAISQLAHGVPTTWPDNDPDLGGDRAGAFSSDEAGIAHPPLGKWLIALGVLLFGPDNGWGLRTAAAVAGVATVAVTMRISFLLTRSLWVACLAGLLLAVDGVHVTLSRVALLDGMLTSFVAFGCLFVLRDQLAIRTRLVSVTWRRPWLLGAGVTFGAAAAIKWSGLYPLAAFLLLITIADVLRRYKAHERHPLMRGLAQALVTALIALPAAFVAYLASWGGWIANRLGALSGIGASGGGSGSAGSGAGADAGADATWWAELWQWHTRTFTWHSGLDAAHPYQSHPLTWPLGLKPTVMFYENDAGWVSIISPIPNPLVALGGVAALLLLIWVVMRALWQAGRFRTLAPILTTSVAVSAFVLTAYLSGWLPWVLTFSRSAVFQFYAVVLAPFAALALALVLAALAGVRGTPPLFACAGIMLNPSADAMRGRRSAVIILVVSTVVLGLIFWPLWSATPMPEWFYRAHLWLPSW